jgi:hypothetical protein
MSDSFHLINRNAAEYQERRQRRFFVLLLLKAEVEAWKLIRPREGGRMKVQDQNLEALSAQRS